jgi:hypothetical protein
MREYPISLSNKVILYLFVLGLFVGAGASVHHAIITPDHDHFLTVVLAFFLTALGIYVIWELQTWLVTVDDKSLTQRTAFSTKSILLKDIAGYQEGEKEYFVLVLKTGKRQQVPQIIARRNELIGWIKENYRNLDALELEMNKKRFLEDDRFGFTKKERGESLKKAKRFAKVANIGGVAIGLWYLFYPVPYDFILSLVLLIPLFAVYCIWRSKGLIRFYSIKESPYPSLGPLFAFLIGVAVLRALSAYDIYTFPPTGWARLLGGITFLATSTLFSAREILRVEGKRGFLIAGIVVAAGGYSYGALIISNCHFDQAPPQVWPVTVTGKHIDKGKTTSYYVAVSPWGKYRDGKDIEVRKSFYNQVQTGEPIKILLKPGKFGIPWYFPVAY